MANPVNDMYADAVVAAVLQAESIDAPIKSITTSAKVDRMHFKVLILNPKAAIFLFIQLIGMSN